MGLVYHFTPNIAGGASVGTPWDTARNGVFSITQPTTRQQVFDAIDEALAGATGMGYARVVVVPNTDIHYYSIGENGDTLRCFRLHFVAGRYVALDVGIKRDGSNLTAGAVTGTANGQAGWQVDLGASDTQTDLQIVGNLDWWYVDGQASNGAGVKFFLGAPDIIPLGVNQNTMTLSAGVAAGEFVTIPLAGYDPQFLRYEVGEQVQILTAAAGDVAQGESTTIVDMSSGQLVVRRLQFAYSAGARIGGRPCRIARLAVSNAELVAAGTEILYCDVPVRSQQLEWPGGDVIGPGLVPQLNKRIEYAWAVSKALATQERGFGSQATTMSRQPYFLARSLAVYSTADDNRTLLGELPGLLDYPGNVSFYGHDNMRDPQETTEPNDYVPFRTSSSSVRYFLMGPTPRDPPAASFISSPVGSEQYLVDTTGASFVEGVGSTGITTSPVASTRRVQNDGTLTAPALVSGALEEAVVGAVHWLASVMGSPHDDMMGQQWGVGGVLLSDLSNPGNGTWQTTLDSINGLDPGTYDITSIATIINGEWYQDRLAGQTAAGHRAALEAWWTARRAALVAAAGQTYQPNLMILSPGYEDDGTPGGDPALVTEFAFMFLDLALNNALGIRYAAPIYPIPIPTTGAGGDDIHSDERGYLWMGEMAAKAIYRLVFQGHDWRPLHADRAWAFGNEVHLRYFVPALAFQTHLAGAPPLRFETTWVPATTNQGFEYIANGGPARNITSVSIGRQEGFYCWVVVTLDGAAPTTTPTASTNGRVTAGPAIRYAGTGGQQYNGGVNPRGNLCDYDQEAPSALLASQTVNGVNLDLRNWGCPQELLITAPQG